MMSHFLFFVFFCFFCFCFLFFSKKKEKKTAVAYFPSPLSFFFLSPIIMSQPKSKPKNLGMPVGKKISSPVWKFFAFELDENRKAFNDKVVHCTVRGCTQVISYSSSTTTMSRHISEVHQIVVEEATSSELSPTKLKQGTLLFVAPQWTHDNPRAQAITKAIAMMIAKDTLPYNFVSGEGFLELMKVIEPK